MHLLHLEDSTLDAEFVESLITKEWPQCQFQRVMLREEFKSALDRGGFDLIISDYTLPDFDGLAALELARQKCPDKPFIFFSGTIGEERAVEALKRGATDYVTKDRPIRIIPAIRQAIEHYESVESRRQADERLSEQAALLDAARDAICVADREHRVTYWNASAERLFGWKATEAIDRDLRTLLFPQDTSAYDQAGKKLSAEGEWRGELRPQTKGGGSIIVESRWTLVRPAAGGPDRVLLINTDITEKKKLEAQFLRAQRMESVGLLTGGVAHDLNNVLNPIVVAANLLRTKLTDTPNQELVEVIETGAEHGAALIKQLLAFACGAEGVRTELKLPRLVADLGQYLRLMLPATIRLSHECKDDLWPVQGDATQLKQVVMNLCLNARDAMPCGGSIAIKASNIILDERFARSVPDGRSGPFVCLSVKDTGTGIPPENLEKIFDPFFTTKEWGKGTGLGLANVRGIIKGHGGCLQVESEVGRGTTFRLYLPAMMGVPASPPAVSPRPSRVRGSGEGVLLIDDDQGVRNILRLLLENAGYRVFLATDGAQGLTKFQAHREQVEVVITDMMMPKMNGPEVIKALRAIDPELPIIAISGLMDGSRLRGTHVPGPPIECLAKPVTIDRLLTAIERTKKKNA